MKRKALAAAVASALVVPTGAQAIEYSFYGHVNRVISFVDDGKGSDIRFLDSSASSSRFGWSGSGDIGRGMQAGARLEAAWQSNLSGSDSVFNGGGVKGGDFPSSGASSADVNLRIRHVVGWFSGNWGTVSLGQTSDAFDGVSFADQSGAWLAAEYSNDYALGYTFRTGGAGSTGLSVFGALGSIDGGRRDLVKYDSPSFGPVSISASAATNNRFDVAGWLDSDLAGGSFLAAIGASRRQPSVAPSPGGTLWSVAGSASYVFSQGTNIYFGYGVQENQQLTGTATEARLLAAGLNTGRDDANRLSVSIGHDWGNNAIRFMYNYGEDFTEDCDSQNFLVGFVHSIPKPRVQMYAGYSFNDLACGQRGKVGSLGVANNTSFEDINVFTVGSRIRFD